MKDPIKKFFTFNRGISDRQAGDDFPLKNRKRKKSMKSLADGPGVREESGRRDLRLSYKTTGVF